MRILIIILFLSSWSLLSAEEVTFKKPPSSLKQWYKPDNKRNVFQHNMFKLRRELQAVNQYRAEKDLPHTQKWANKLVEHYLKIADMVPEWKSELRLKRAEQLKIAANEGDFKSLGRAIKKLQKNKAEAQIALKDVRSGITTLRSSCDSCHKGTKAKDYYLGEEATELMDKLEAAIEKGESGRPLGEFAVHACAHCHGSHRIIYDIKNEIEK